MTKPEEQEKIDLKDKRILYELDVNSRQSYSQIGKKVKLPKTVVFHRIQSLIKRGILKNTYALVQFAKLGFTQYKIYLKFHSINPQKEEEIIDFLIKERNIIWVSSCRGKWDIAITIIAKDIIDFDNVLKEIVNNYGKYILDKDIVIVGFSSLYSRNYLLQEKEKQEFVYMKKLENLKIDDEEQSILRILANNSRISILEIMEKLKFSRDLVSYRIKKLKKQDIILCYRALINLEKVGFHLYKIIFRLNNFSKEHESEIISYCKSNSNIVQYIRLVGNWDIEIEIEIENEGKLYKIINEIRNKFDKIIRDYEVLHIVEEHKLNFYPL